MVRGGEPRQRGRDLGPIMAGHKIPPRWRRIRTEEDREPRIWERSQQHGTTRWIQSPRGHTKDSRSIRHSRPNNREQSPVEYDFALEAVRIHGNGETPRCD